MSILSKAKFVVFNPKKNSDALKKKRKQICDGISEQISLAKNPSYRPISYKWTTGVDGEVKKTRVYKKLKPWWYESDNNTLILSIKYRGKPLKLVDDYNGVEVSDEQELITTLEKFKSEFEKGDLDNLLTALQKT
ncbi:MAG: hypothetical protein CMM44_06025 [Rhodospirillaceae bacterium]|nr:hypothetical protein [Rhodospirillaceae bacterium]|tara:strand:+ start:715 stop:1119 length:405 start_codon:yes stop_codon:yes gene_type:complete